jgi:hypothetical protein
MLKPDANYTAEMVTFGGYRKPRTWASPPETLVGKCLCNEPNSPYSLRVRLDEESYTKARWAWEKDLMPGPRNGADSIILPNGLVLLCNGAGAGLMTGGYSGGSYAANPVLNAW